MSYMSNIAAATGPISMLDVAEACGLTGGGEITITSFYCGGCNLPVTSTSMPNAGAIDFAAMRNAKVIYSPEALTSTLDMTYPSTPAAIAAFESGFIADLASNLHLPASLLAVTTSPGPGGVGTVVTSVVTLPYNQAVAGAALGRLSAAASTNDPSVLVGPSTLSLMSSGSMATSFSQRTQAAAPPVALPLGSAGLSNDRYVAPLDGFFVTSPPGLPLAYAITGNPFGSASILSNNLLSVAGSNRGTSYSVGVVAATANSFSCSNVLTVTEYSPVTVAALNALQPPTALLPTQAVALSAAAPTASFLTSSLFLDPAASPLTFSLSNMPAAAAGAATIAPNAGVEGGMVLSVTNAFRGAAYPVTMRATNGFGKSASWTLNVTEPAPPAPVEPASLGSVALTTNTCNIALGPLFADSTGLGLTYALASNPYGSAAVLNGTLSVTGAARASVGPYVVAVRALNSYGGASAAAALTVTESGSRAPVASGALPWPGSATLGAGLLQLSLPSYFTNPLGAGKPLAYSASVAGYSGGAPAPAPVLVGAGGGVLLLQGAGRGTAYGVVVAASNAAGGVAQTLAVTEVASNAAVTAPSVAIPLGSSNLGVGAGAGTLAYALSSCFAGTAPAYALTANPFSNTTISGGTLAVRGAYRAATYSVAVTASNAAGAATSTLAVTEPSPAVVATSLGAASTAAAAGATLTYALPGYFADPTGGALMYKLTANPCGSAALVGSTLVVTGQMRGATYGVTVQAADAAYPAAGATSTLTVTEPAAPPAPVLSAIPALSGSAVSALTFALAGYQTRSGVGALTWSLLGAVPAGVSVAAATGVLTVAAGTVLTSQALTVKAANGAGAFATQAFVATTTVAPGTLVSYLLVAGGGGAGGNGGGGGGAGGLLAGAGAVSYGTTYTVSVGTGGAGTSVGTPNSGTSSTLEGAGISVAAVGGGGGNSRNYPSPNPLTGGSGGGAAGSGTNQGGNAANTGAAGTAGQGNGGGNGTNYSTTTVVDIGVDAAGGGGGGAGAAGGVGTYRQGGNGGAGLASSIAGTAVTYAGGGAGGVVVYGSGGAGGSGGGGGAGVAGSANTGGGGGGGNGNKTGGVGGTGVVIVAIPTVSYLSSNITGTFTTAVVGANTVVKFTSGTGTFVAVAPPSVATTGSMPATVLVSGAATFALASYFSYGGALAYAVTANPQSSASIAAGVLTVQGAARGGAAYVVTVTATDTSGATATQSVTITELAALPAAPTATGTVGPFKLASASNASIALSGSFVRPSGSVAYAYSLSNNPLSNASINAASGALTLAGVSGCNAQYTLATRVTDSFAQYATQNVSLTSVAPPGTVAFPAVTLAASSNASIALDGYFSTAYGAPLAYSLTASPYSNVSIASGVATVTSATRGATYGVGIAATDALGQATTNTVSVTEAAYVYVSPLAGVPTPVLVLDATQLSVSPVSTWGSTVKMTQGNVSLRPTWSSTGGGQSGTKPYVLQDATRWLSTPSDQPITFNGSTNGGLTVVSYMNFTTTTSGGNTRFFDMGYYGGVAANNGFMTWEQRGRNIHVNDCSGPSYTQFINPDAEFVNVIGSTTEWAVFIMRISNSAHTMEMLKFLSPTTAATVASGAFYQSWPFTLPAAVFANQTWDTNGFGGAHRGLQNAPAKVNFFAMFDYSLTNAQVASMTNALL